MHQNSRLAVAMLASLTVLQLVMLSALFAGVAPHPPASIPMFGIAPFIAVSLSIGIAAIVVGPLTGFWGKGLSILAGLLALLSYGPQKYLDPAFPAIWPSVIFGQLAVAVLFLLVFRNSDKENQTSDSRDVYAEVE